MGHESKGSRFVRGLVKFVFIVCYIAFMWASIHHIAAFFNNFEASDNTVGSYLLAGAFDVTALVTTIGVMFFRRSMPGAIQVLVWTFILAIAAYSFFINWEYAAHFQSAALTLQTTGETAPIYDSQGVLHYVPIMRQNTTLLFVNPLLASGFTVFSLVYSVIAEFFGTKPPTTAELEARKKYLNDTVNLHTEIKELEAKTSGPGLLERGEKAALELKERIKKVTTTEPEKKEEQTSFPTPLPAPVVPDKVDLAIEFVTHNPQGTDEELAQYLGMKRAASARFWRLKALDIMPRVEGENEEELPPIVGQETPEPDAKDESIPMVKPEYEDVVNRYQKIEPAILAGAKSLSISQVKEIANCQERMILKLIDTGVLKQTKRNKELLTMESVLAWLSSRKVPAKTAKPEPKTNGNGHAKVTQELIENLVELDPFSASKN